MQVEISGFSESEHFVVFCLYENIILFFFWPSCEMQLKNFLHRVWEPSGLFFEL